MTGLLPRPGAAPVDILLATTIAAGFCLEGTVGVYAEGPVWANLLVGVLAGASVLWRRSAPGLTGAALLAVGTIHSFLLTPVDMTLSVLLMLILVGYSTTRYGQGTRAVWIVALVAAGVVAIEIAKTRAAENVVFPVVVLCTGAVAGGAVRARVREARVLAERTHELEAERARGEQAAVVDERRRIARDLHDVVAHTVSVMVVQAGAARRTMDRDPARAIAALDAVRSTGGDAVAELDRLLGLLDPEEARTAATRPGLDALGHLADRMAAAGLPVTVAASGRPRPLDAATDLVAYRVVQEALTNTLKHARAATAAVALAWTDAALEITVHDDGEGAAASGGQGARRGLQGMRERIEAYGGELEAGPAPGRGFRVRARLPLRREREVQPA